MYLSYLILAPLAVYYGLGFVYLLLSGAPISPIYVPLVAVVFIATIPFLSRESSPPRRVHNYEWVTAIVFEFIVLLCVFQLDLEGFRLTSESVRVESIWERMLIVHLLVSWFSALVLTGHLQVESRLVITICALCILQSVVIGLLEGRRTAAVLPFVFLVFLYAGRTELRLKQIVSLSLIAVAMLAVFFAVTSLRVDTSIAANLLYTRLFWPAIALNDVLIQQPSFSPETMGQIVNRALDGVGVGEYTSTTNAFGRYMGYISPQNYVIGINYGIVAESYLLGGALAVPIAHVLILALLRISMKLSEAAPFNLAMILPFLYVHGYQMEIPYTVIVLLKATVAFGILAIAVELLPKRSRGFARA